MTELKKEKCVACRADAPAVTGAERDELMKQIPEWRVEEDLGVPHLIRHFKFSDYVTAVAFANKVAEVAEQADHHPAILLEWGKVKVSWWTHKIKNLHRNDFIMASKTDELLTA